MADPNEPFYHNRKLHWNHEEIAVLHDGITADRAGREAALMDPQSSNPQAEAAAQEMLGYLNFSSGTADPKFQRNANFLFRSLGVETRRSKLVWEEVGQCLRAQLRRLKGTSAAFGEVEQAQAAIELVFNHLLPKYREFHRDLLCHQSSEALFGPFFVARAFEAVLQQGPPFNESERIIQAALVQLNGFLGHRPVAVLQTPQRIEPYAHEWVCPIPLYLRGVGIACGPYHNLVEQALAILAATDSEISDQASFSLALLDELALDPRAYDFDHPVNKRPNYQFGQWDPHRIDNQGRFRRFVLQEVTLEALCQRLAGQVLLPADELQFEAGAVLAGTMLMASAVSGRGPETHDSGTTLATLVPRIAAFRDSFYQRLLSGVAGAHGERLRAEAATLRQPFGGARQHLNQCLARLRAVQLQHVHLAQLFARMGFPDASSRQAQVVPVASARLLCEINGRLTGGHHAIDRGQVAQAAGMITEIEDLLDRAIECGALVDPWNVLGFQGQFSLFPAMENSVRDHRVDVLIHLMEQIFGLYARLEGEAAARGDGPLAAKLAADMKKRARWWDRFATLDVAGVSHVSGREAAESASHVADALGAWQRAGAAAGDVAFWRQHVDRFTSPKSYALVVDALLEQRDFVAALALLIQWLGQAAEVPLVEGEYSFHDLADRWFRGLSSAEAPTTSAGSVTSAAPVSSAAPIPPAAVKRWPLTVKFFDYLEANAEEYWEVPQFEFGAGRAPGGRRDRGEEEAEPDAEHDPDLFSAAYDDVVYRDSTADGHEADMLEGPGLTNDFELDFEATRLEQRLAFLSTLARLWKLAAGVSSLATDARERDTVLRGWFARAVSNRRELFELLRSAHRFRIPAPGGTHEALVEYDRRRLLKESLLARIVTACVETSSAARWLLAACNAGESVDGRDGGDRDVDLADWEQRSVGVLRAMFRGDAERVRTLFPELRAVLEREPILYVPLSRHGAPGQIVGAQTLQHLLLALLHGLPRLGLLTETCQVIATAQAMEQHRPDREGAVTEFDRLFEVGYRAIVEAMVRAAIETRAVGDTPTVGTSPADGERLELTAVSDSELIHALQLLTEALLKRWLGHSRSLRLSVLEKVAEHERWQALVGFIERYGHDLFTPRFFNLGNLRAILHQGVGPYLDGLARSDAADEIRLVSELEIQIPRATAVEQLGLVIEAIVENFGEFKDYNSTTTQSDQGELLHVLLDFLRLKVGYDRFAWNIKPVVLAHEILVRHGRMAAAELWRRAVADRTSRAADWHLRRFGELVEQYSVRLPTIADRLGERFVRPLAIDRVRALIRPAIEEARRGDPPTAFDLLEQELVEFTENPSGAGLDVPAWLTALENEVDEVGPTHHRGLDADDVPPPVPTLALSWEVVQQQLQNEDL